MRHGRSPASFSTWPRRLGRKARMRHDRRRGAAAGRAGHAELRIGAQRRAGRATRPVSQRCARYRRLEHRRAGVRRASRHPHVAYPGRARDGGDGMSDAMNSHATAIKQAARDLAQGNIWATDRHIETIDHHADDLAAELAEALALLQRAHDAMMDWHFAHGNTSFRMDDEEREMGAVCRAIQDYRNGDLD